MLRRDRWQRAALGAYGNQVIVAGPGTGKTRLLTAKMAVALRDRIRPPRGAACITFSNETARELQRRLAEYEIRSGKNIFVGTLHTFCLLKVVIPYARLCGISIPEDFRIPTDEEMERGWAQAIEATRLATGRSVSKWDAIKERRLHPIRGDDWSLGEHAERNAILQYEDWLRSRGLLDFDDMVILAANMLRRHRWVRRALLSRFQVVVIDEYQDLGVGLHEVVKSIIQEEISTIWAAGDPQQSIYSFTGARPELMRELHENLSFERLPLCTNFRSAPDVLNFVRRFSASPDELQNWRTEAGAVRIHAVEGGRREMAVFIVTELLGPLFSDSREPPETSIGVMYRGANHGEEIASLLSAHSPPIPFARYDKGAPYQKTLLNAWAEDAAAWAVSGGQIEEVTLGDLGKFYAAILRGHSTREQQRKDRIRLLSFLKSNSSGSTDASSWLLNLRETVLSPRGEVSPLLENLLSPFEDMVRAFSDSGVLEESTLADLASRRTDEGRIVLTTVHQAKGRQFHTAILMGRAEDGQRIEQGGYDESEISNHFFVAATRAANYLHICVPSSNY